MYSKTIENNNMFEKNEDMMTKNETYQYIGQHVDGCDRYGPIDVYHYISNSLLGNRKLKDVSHLEYDLELWPGDKLWLKASRKEPITIEYNI
jgi:hypothetical protein